jgi:hypothetical protein
MRHKWADVLIAIANGKAVEFKRSDNSDWETALDYQEDADPLTFPDYEWRVKKEAE